MVRVVSEVSVEVLLPLFAMKTGPHWNQNELETITGTVLHEGRNYKVFTACLKVNRG